MTAERLTDHIDSIVRPFLTECFTNVVFCQIKYLYFVCLRYRDINQRLISRKTKLAERVQIPPETICIHFAFLRKAWNYSFTPTMK